jgi:hypothetical protein
MESVRSSVSIASGLPRETVRSAPAIIFSGPAQRSLTLWPARSRSRQATLYTESSDSFVASAAASIATGWSEPVPGRELHPLKSSASHGALFQQLPPKQQRKPTHNHASGKNDVHCSMPFCSWNSSVVSPESKQKIAMFLLVESTVEEICPIQQARYPKDFAS